MPHKKTGKIIDATVVTPKCTINSIYYTGLYLRLSREEEANGEKLDNQRDLLLNYIKSKPELKIVDIYSDNGETGTNFDRPEWNRLMADVEKKHISCIVVKDLSRFGRNYIETGTYLELVFPTLHVRFIAVNDNYDSNQLENSALQPLDTMIKGIVNEAYAKDISRKIFTAKEIQRKNGLYYGNIPPYGYCKDPQDPHHLIIDQQTAPNVQQIFQWKLEGMNNSQIARTLNENNILAPMRYQFLAGAVKAPRYENSIWQGITIKGILSNRSYTGDLAMGKKRKNLSKNLTKSKNIPCADWTITPNTHEAIISRKLFLEVQNICLQELEKNKARHSCHSDIKSPDDLFAGLVYSKNTGLKMYRARKYSKKHGIKYRYTTISQRDANYSRCPIITVKEEQIREILACLLQKQIELTHNTHIAPTFYKNDFLSKNFIQKLIDKVYVYNSKTIEIVFKCRNEIEPIWKFQEGKAPL